MKLYRIEYYIFRNLERKLKIVLDVLRSTENKIENEMEKSKL